MSNESESINNSEVLKLLRQYIEINGPKYRRLNSNTVNKSNNEALLEFGKKLHSISLKKYPNTSNNSREKLPLKVFEDYPKCTIPIVKQEDDLYIFNENGGTNMQLTYMMSYCSPIECQYQKAVDFFTRTTCGPLVQHMKETPFEINYHSYFNHTGKFYRKAYAQNAQNQAYEYAGEWNVIQLLCCLHTKGYAYEDGKNLFTKLCSNSKQSKFSMSSKILDLDQVSGGLTPIGRILSSLDYTCLPFFHRNTFTVLNNGSGKFIRFADIEDFHHVELPFYINTLIYYQNINNTHMGDTKANYHSLFKQVYVEPNTELLKILLECDIDVQTVLTNPNSTPNLLPIDFCCFNGYNRCLSVFLDKKPELLNQQPSYYLDLIAKGLEEVLNKFFNDRNMRLFFKKLIPDEISEYEDNIMKVLIKAIMTDFNSSQKFLAIDNFKKILEPFYDGVQVKKEEFEDSEGKITMKYLHLMIRSFIITGTLCKDFKNKEENRKNISYQINLANYNGIKTVKDFQNKLKKRHIKTNLTSNQRTKIEDKIRNKYIQNKIKSATFEQIRTLDAFKMYVIDTNQADKYNNAQLNKLLENGTKLRGEYNQKQLEMNQDERKQDERKQEISGYLTNLIENPNTPLLYTNRKMKKNVSINLVRNTAKQHFRVNGDNSIINNLLIENGNLNQSFQSKKRVVNSERVNRILSDIRTSMGTDTLQTQPTQKTIDFVNLPENDQKIVVSIIEGWYGTSDAAGDQNFFNKMAYLLHFYPFIKHIKAVISSGNLWDTTATHLLSQWYMLGLKKFNVENQTKFNRKRSALKSLKTQINTKSNQNQKKVSDLIDYKCVPGSHNDLESNSQYTTMLSLLKEVDENFTTRIPDTRIQEQYIKHAIECCYKSFNTSKGFNRSKYGDLSKWLIKNKIENEQLMAFFFNSIKEFSLNEDIFFAVLRFQRLSYILCMNRYLLNNYIKIKENKTVFEWYKLVYTKLLTSIGGILSKKTNSPSDTQVINKNKRKIELLYDVVIKFLEGKPININKLQSNLSANNQTANGGGSSKEYIKLQKGGKRLIRYGGRGGRYYMKGGHKIYVNK